MFFFFGGFGCYKKRNRLRCLIRENVKWMRHRRKEGGKGRKLTTLTGQTEVGTDVCVPFVVHRALLLNSLEEIIVALPDGATDYLISICSTARSQEIYLWLAIRERALLTNTRISRPHGILSESWPIAQNKTCGYCSRTQLCTIQSRPPQARILWSRLGSHRRFLCACYCCFDHHQRDRSFGGWGHWKKSLVIPTEGFDYYAFFKGKPVRGEKIYKK